MGHTRLGALPKTRKWNELLKHIAGLVYLAMWSIPSRMT